MIVSRSNIICQYTGAFFLRIAKQAKKLGLKLLQSCDANQFKITQDKAGNMLICFDSDGQQNTLSLYEFIQQDHHTKLIGEQKNALLKLIAAHLPDKDDYALQPSKYDNCFDIYKNGLLHLGDVYCLELIQQKLIIKQLSSYDYNALMEKIVNIKRVNKVPNLATIDQIKSNQIKSNQIKSKDKP